MSELMSVTNFIDELLSVRDFDRDVSNNGLQVEASSEVKKIGFAVDGCLETFMQAIENNCDLLVVHHGISWGSSLKRISGMDAKRIKALFCNGLSLYAAHLPLDAHPNCGNNVQLCKMLNVKNLKSFAQYAGYEIGFHGILQEPKSLGDFVKLVEDQLGTKCAIIGDSNLEKKISTVGIVSGGAADEMADAAKLGLDVYLTGEVAHQHIHTAKELNQTVIAAGHYCTETVGVKQLMKIVAENFAVECIFIDNPTGY
ncbi:MAG: Nif3-like dinuclear metal center hexameric protein [Lentisphaeria bacterium]